MLTSTCAASTIRCTFAFWLRVLAPAKIFAASSASTISSVLAEPLDVIVASVSTEASRAFVASTVSSDRERASMCVPVIVRGVLVLGTLCDLVTRDFL